MHGTTPNQLGRNHRLRLLRCPVGGYGLGVGGDFEMSDTQLPKALQLAEKVVSTWAHKPPEWAVQTAAELRRLHAELEQARAALAAQGEPVAWRWFNSNGDQVTNWLDFKPSQRGSIESQVSEAGGHVEYAYTHPAPAASVSVSDEDIDKLHDSMFPPPAFESARVEVRKFARALLALRPAQAGVQTGWMKAPGIPAKGGA